MPAKPARRKRSVVAETTPEFLPRRILERDGFTPLPITLAHADAVGRLAAVHRDPFDRMLVAQAELGELTILSADAVSRSR